MAIAPVQGAVNSANPNPQTSLTLTWGSATTSGNYLVAVFAFIGTVSPGTFTLPTGWTQRGSTHQNGNCWLAIFESANAASQSGAQTWSWTGGINNVCGVMEEYSGVKTSSPNDGADATNTGSTATLSTGAVSVNNTGDVVLGCFADGNTSTSNTVSFSAPTPTSPVAAAIRQSRVQSDVTDTSGCMVALTDLLPGATGNQTMGVTCAARTWFGVGFSLLPAGAATTTTTTTTTTTLQPMARDANLSLGGGGSWRFVDPLGY